MFEVADDSGFLAVVVPKAYSAFVARDWKLDQLFNHFRHQMARQVLLIWGTGLEGIWKVDVRVGRSSIQGFREVAGPLHVDGGAILVTNYESLTMAAQFTDVRLPEEHQEDQLVSLADGDYSCRIIQMFDPEGEEPENEGEADFVIEFSQPETLPAIWSDVPWFTLKLAEQ
jgi:hypothetical protein